MCSSGTSEGTAPRLFFLHPPATRLTLFLAMIQSPRMSQYRLIYSALVSLYGEPVWQPGLAPVDELISTILSQNTSDANRDLAFGRIKLRFESWDAVRAAPLTEVLEAIRPAGLANRKAPRIQNILQILWDEQGAITLEPIASMPLEEARAWLLALPGVGPKTAAIVLLFAFGRPAFPVDTHVHRLSKRLGLIPKTMSAEKAHRELERIVPTEHYYSFHLNLIRHGRQVCRARIPACQRCGLHSFCQHYQGLSGPESG